MPSRSRASRPPSWFRCALPDELIGLLVAYLPATRRLAESESTLLSALAGQLAVAVQNAGLHEDTARLARERQEALDAELVVAKRLEAFYEISRSFSESLSLDETVDAIARTAVELLEVDAAVLRMPDERGDSLVARAIHVPDARLGVALDPILRRPQPLDRIEAATPAVLGPQLGAAPRARPRAADPVPRARGDGSARPDRVDRRAAGHADPASRSIRPVRSTRELLEAAHSLAAQAALAIDSARLYEQQKYFSDTMQRSLLPTRRPDLPGLDVGSVYESSARVEVGGDVYDFTVLPDGRLAVAVGDVTGKGIDATADMAMTKFVFRSLAREHPEPCELMRIANEVALDEVEEGKFVTMLYLTLDPVTGELACASAGHPQPRLVRPDGTVEELEARGLALGIAPDQNYPEVTASSSRARPSCSTRTGSSRPGSAASSGATRLDRLLASIATCRRSSWRGPSSRTPGRSRAAGSRTTPPWSSSSEDSRLMGTGFILSP